MMDRTDFIVTCTAVVCFALAGCSRSENTRQPQADDQPSQADAQPPHAIDQPPAPRGVLIVNTSGPSDSPDQTVESYRIGSTTIPGRDMKALAAAIKASREALPADEDMPRLIIDAKGDTHYSLLAPAVKTAIDCGYDYVDVRSGLPAPERPDLSAGTNLVDPIRVKVVHDAKQDLTYFIVQGSGSPIRNERNLGSPLSRFKQILGRIDRSTGLIMVPFLVEASPGVKEKFVLAGHSRQSMPNSGGLSQPECPRHQTPQISGLTIPRCDCPAFGRRSSNSPRLGCRLSG